MLWVWSVNNTNIMQSIAASRRIIQYRTIRNLKYASNVRYYTRDTRLNEPERMVRSEFESIDPSAIKVSYFRENTRAEIWKLHKENPEIWDYQKLAQKYGAAVDRIRAVIILMRKREESMKKDGVYEISDEWKSIWALHKEDPEKNTADLVAKELSLEMSEVSRCIEKMQQHEDRLKRLKHYTAMYEDIVEELEEQGVNTSFKESLTDKKARRLPRKFVEGYKPALIPDDDFESQKKMLIRRIIGLTKAEADKSVYIDGYLKTEEEKLALNKKFASEGLKSDLTNYKIPKSKLSKEKPAQKSESKTATGTTTAAPSNTHEEDKHIDDDLDEEPDDVMCRWKFAFRDLSKAAREANVPTMIRTRKGLWRCATPLEELNRSWQRKPDPLELSENQHMLEKYVDFDGDEAELAEMLQKKKERKEKLKAELVAAKA